MVGFELGRDSESSFSDIEPTISQVVFPAFHLVVVLRPSLRRDLRIGAVPANQFLQVRWRSS
jgi:hypothetical protein